MISAAPKLRAISRFGVGVDSIDVGAATQAGIGVTYTPGTNTDAVADLTMAIMLGLARSIPAAAGSMRSGVFERFVGVELSGQTLGLIGLGSTGLAVSRRAQACGMRVVALARPSAALRAKQYGIELLTIDRLLTRADVLSVHVPLTAETRGLIGHAELAALPRGAFVINTARGGVVDESALLLALKSGHIGGAGLDVFEREPPGDNPLLRLDSVIATPHIGGATHAAFLRTGLEAVDNLIAVLGDDPPPTLLNPEALKVIR